MIIKKQHFRKVIKFIETLFFRIKYKFVRPAYPKNPDNKVLVHLGCGEINSPEFINIDTRYFSHIHHVHDVCNLPFFKANFADLIYTSHTLEHVPIPQLKEVLLEWRRVLKKGGVLRIGVPNFDTILSIYKDNNNSIDAIWRPLMGGQDYLQNFHFAVFNKNYLEKLLKECGFEVIREWNPNEVDYHNFEDWTSVKYEVNGKTYPISLNLEATK